MQGRRVHDSQVGIGPSQQLQQEVFIATCLLVLPLLLTAAARSAVEDSCKNSPSMNPLPTTHPLLSLDAA